MTATQTTTVPRRRVRLDLRRSALLLAAAGSVLGTVYLADSAREHDGASRIDPILTAQAMDVRTPVATDVARLLTLVGSEVVVGGIALLVLGFLVWRRRTAQAVPFALAMGGSVFLTVALKLLVARPRPPGPDALGPVDLSFSFPSGHTLNSAVLIALVVWLCSGRFTTLGRILLAEIGGLLAVGIGASRIYLGYHWSTDVAASWLVATAVLVVVGLVSPLVVGEVTRLTARPSAGRAARPRPRTHLPLSRSGARGAGSGGGEGR